MFFNKCSRKRVREKEILTSMKKSEIEGLDGVSQLIKTLKRERVKENRDSIGF